MNDAATSPANRTGCIVAVILFVGLLAIGKCSSRESQAALNTTEIVDNGVDKDAVEASPSASATLGAPGALDARSVTRGGKSFQTAQGSEGFPGAMIFSQNCYAALSGEFSWSKLDGCGGFDAAAVLAMDQNSGDAGSNELTYFDSEAAAGRYLAAATAAGESAEKADLRWSALTAKAVRPRPAPKVETETSSEAEGLVLNDFGDTNDRTGD